MTAITSKQPIKQRDEKFRSRSAFFILGLLPLLGFTGCVSQPDSGRNYLQTDLETGYLNLPNDREETGVEIEDWWNQLGSASIDALVVELFENNLTIKEASERVMQSMERLKVQTGSRLPGAAIEAGKSRSFAPSPTGDGSRVYATQFSTELAVSWQSDAFGKIRNSVYASEAAFFATEADRMAIEQSLVSELTRRLLSHETNTQLLKLAEANLQNRKDFLELVERRYEMGSVSTSLSEVYLAREAYSSVEAEVAEFERLITENVYHIDLLLGERAGSTNLTAMDFSVFMDDLPESPAAYPASLLDYRPDLQAAEFRVQAADANVKVAVADLYPSLGITGALSLSNADFSELFNLDNLVGSIFTNLTQPLFKGGSLKADVRIQESALRESAYSYEGKVLNAIREVETALQAEQRLSMRIQSQDLSVEALQKSEELAEKRYRDGLQSLQSFLEIQQRRYLAEQNRLLTQQQRWNTRIDLYLALGGKVPA